MDRSRLFEPGTLNWTSRTCWLAGWLAVPGTLKSSIIEGLAQRDSPSPSPACPQAWGGEKSEKTSLHAISAAPESTAIHGGEIFSFLHWLYNRRDSNSSGENAIRIPYAFRSIEGVPTLLYVWHTHWFVLESDPLTNSGTVASSIKKYSYQEFYVLKVCIYIVVKRSSWVLQHAASA